MKILIRSIKTNGQALLLCLGITVVLGISLVGIFSYTTNQLSAVARSQSWNESLVLAEAGIEDALQEINKYSNTSTPGSSWNTTSATDYWLPLAGNVYYVRRFINSDYYDVYITNSPTAPAIRSQGVKVTGNNFNRRNLTRTVWVQTKSASLFQAGLLAKNGITLNGNVVIDSFDSQNLLYSTNGQYIASKRKDGGNVATVVSNMNFAVSVGGSVQVFGKLYTGPGDTIKLAGGGSVGSLGWVNGGSAGIQSDWSQHDLNISIPDAPLPPTGGLSLPTKGSNTFQGASQNNSYLLTSGNYQTAALTLGSSDKILVTGNVKLYLNGNFLMSGGNSQIVVGTNSSLTIYAGGSLSIGGSGAANMTGYATNLTVYGLTNNTSITLGGNAGFTGVIYAPHAAFTFNGGGSTPLDVMGSVVADSITMNGKSQTHYDESLAKVPVGASYVVTAWKEL